MNDEFFKSVLAAKEARFQHECVKGTPESKAAFDAAEKAVDEFFKPAD